MPLKYNNTQPTEIKYNGTSLTDVKYGSTVVWRKRTVTYYSETGTTRTATYIEGQAISLSANYAVAKSGYSFVGWRQDRSASSSVISSLTMGSSNVSLYAVYRKSIIVTYYNNSTSATSTSGYQYYNTGNVTNPSFKLTQSSRSGWNARGWSTSTAANGSISYNNGASFTRDSNITLRGMYQKTVTLSYNGNGATGGSTASQSGTAYYNSGSNSTINPSFTVRSNGFTRTNYKFVNWRLNSTSGTAYNAGASITLSSNITMYAYWEASWVTSTFTINKGQTQIDSTQGIYIFPTFSYSFSITGNCISQGSPGQIKALCRCNVTFTCRLMCRNVDDQSVAFAIYLYKNGSLYTTLQSKIECLEYRDLMFGFSGKPFHGTTIQLNGGDTLDFRVQVFQSSGSAKARVNFRTKSETDGVNVGVCGFTAVPV